MDRRLAAGAATLLLALAGCGSSTAGSGASSGSASPKSGSSASTGAASGGATSGGAAKASLSAPGLAGYTKTCNSGKPITLESPLAVSGGTVEITAASLVSPVDLSGNFAYARLKSVPRGSVLFDSRSIHGKLARRLGWAIRKHLDTGALKPGRYALFLRLVPDKRTTTGGSKGITIRYRDGAGAHTYAVKGHYVFKGKCRKS